MLQPADGRSFETVRNALRTHVEERTPGVVTLGGRWGTGKTHLWKSIDRELIAKSPRWEWERIYVSCFGLRSIEELQWRLLQNIHAEDEGVLRRTANEIIGAARQLAASAHWSGKLADHVASIVAPKLLEKRLVILDDLERISKSLDIGDLMGFINQYAESNDTRFLLILNLDELGEHSGRWRNFREKVVTREILLSPTVAEAFDVAANGRIIQYSEHAREVASKLKIDNIRVLQRIVAVIKDVLGGYIELPQDVLHRVVPSLVLLPGVFYRAVDDAPSMQTLLAYDPTRHFIAKENKQNVDPETQKAYELLSAIGIYEPDPFESEIAKGLETGIVDCAATKRIIDGYLANASKLGQAERCDEIHFNYEFDARKAPDDLLADIRRLATEDILIDATRVTTICTIATSLGDARLGVQIVEKWISRYTEELSKESEDSRDQWEAPSTLHPRILAAIGEARSVRQQGMGPIDAALNIERNSGWGSREREALGSAQPGDYIDRLSDLSKEDLRIVFRQHLLEFRRRDSAEHPYFRTAADAFVEACKQIVASQPNSRIAWIIERRFQERGLTNELSPGSRQDLEGKST
jgi:hypothetical protein